MYKTRSNDGKFIYSYNGKDYALPESIHQTFQRDPSEGQKRFILSIKKQSEQQTSSRVPSIDEIRDSQTTQRLRPDRNRPDRYRPDRYRPDGFDYPYDRDSYYGASDPYEGITVQPTGFNRPIPRDRERDDYRGSSALTEFAWNLFKNSNSNQNYAISSISPQILLSYLALVADGQTRNELVQAIGFGSPNQIQKLIRQLLTDGTKRELQIATAFFTAQEMRLARFNLFRKLFHFVLFRRINEEFLKRAVAQNVDVVNVDFKHPEAASRTITKWATQKTKGGLKITDINYAPSTKIALTSAIYFKGNWVYTFHPAKPGIFHTPKGDVTAEMMNMKRKFRWGKIGDLAQWAAMPYESDDSLVIILPNEDKTVEDVINNLGYRELDDVMTGMDSDSSNADVNITLPKFKFESTTSLVEPLQKVRRNISPQPGYTKLIFQMGISTLFSPRASLPYLSDYDAVQVSNAQQQASLEVNENGTVLIAFTNLNVVALSFQAPVPKVEFNVNRPFLAIIGDRNRNIPFVIAKVLDPTA